MELASIAPIKSSDVDEIGSTASINRSKATITINGSIVQHGARGGEGPWRRVRGQAALPCSASPFPVAGSTLSDQIKTLPARCRAKSVLGGPNQCQAGGFETRTGARTLRLRAPPGSSVAESVPDSAERFRSKIRAVPSRSVPGNV
eukprot:1063484-Rhodomonas_salina.1